MKKPSGRMILISLVLLMMIPLVSSSAFAGEIRVITGQKTPTDTLSDDMIQSIFLGKKTSWPDGNAVEFVVLSSGDTHDVFLKTYVKKSASQFKIYWNKQVFTGKGKNPKSFDSESDLLAYVAGKAGTVGYVSASTDVAMAKILNEK